MDMRLGNSDVKKCQTSPLFSLSSTSSYVKLSYAHCSEQGAFTPSISAEKYTALYYGIYVHLQEALNKERNLISGSFHLSNLQWSIIGHMQTEKYFENEQESLLEIQ